MIFGDFIYRTNNIDKFTESSGHSLHMISLSPIFRYETLYAESNLESTVHRTGSRLDIRFVEERSQCTWPVPTVLNCVSFLRKTANSAISLASLFFSFYLSLPAHKKNFSTECQRSSSITVAVTRVFLCLDLIKRHYQVDVDFLINWIKFTFVNISGP